MIIKVCDNCPNGSEIHMLLLFLIRLLFVNLLHSCTLLFVHTSSYKFNVRPHRHNCYLMKSFVIFKKRPTTIVFPINDATPGFDDVVHALKCECYVISQKGPLIRIVMIVINGKPDIFA